MSYLQIPRRRLQFTIREVRAQFPYALYRRMDQTRFIQGAVSYVQTEIRMDRQCNCAGASTALIVKQLLTEEHEHTASKILPSSSRSYLILYGVVNGDKAASRAGVGRLLIPSAYVQECMITFVAKCGGLHRNWMNNWHIE